MPRGLWLFVLALLIVHPARGADLPHTVWLEAETFATLKGSNFSYQPVAAETKGSWSISGPGVAAEWTQGGESEWMSIAARADEPGEVVVGREAEMPAAAKYTLWVRYADYRNKKESFGVRIKQGDKVFTHVFGEKPVVDELDPMKLRWDWAFGWDHVELDLQKGPARVELYTTGPTEARRQVDCLCLTTDTGYKPAGREKPDCAAWLPLRAMRKAGLPDVEPLVKARPAGEVPKSWKIAEGPPVFLWNAGQPWLDEMKKPLAERVDWPFTVDPPLEKDFLAAFKGKALAVYGDALSGPSIHIPLYPTSFKEGSPFMDWLTRHPDRKFAMLLNYAEPAFPAPPQNADKPATYANFKKFNDRFIGFIAGEGLAYASPDGTVMDAKLKAAKTRGDILAALREGNTAAVVKKFSDYYGAPVTPEEAWGPDVSCLSAGMEVYSHALANWGMKRIGHESTGNSPVLARRLAFLRGAARQFGAKILDYQSANLGDSSTIFSRQGAFYPASSRYILDNQYDAWAGAGVNWVLKDYVLFDVAGADAFYHEEGNDIFWKPGGNSAGDDFPIDLSPRGRVTEAVIKLARSHPRGTQFTPIAFLLDEAHGWTQESFTPGSFGLNPELNPPLLMPGRHEAAIRGWFDVAYFPAPETQNEPATAIRQSFVNGMFGDIFDVIVTAPKHTEIAGTYPVLIAAGEINLTEEWGKALHDYMQAGGTLVAAADQFTGPGAATLGLPAFGAAGEASELDWKLTGEKVPSNVFRYRALPADAGRVLAATSDGKPLAIAAPQGQGQLITVAVPLGLGLDNRPVPVLSLLARHLTQGLVPVKVTGDIEWTLNRLDDGGWLITLLNNRGVNKPQHGVNPVDHHEAQAVTLNVPFKIQKSSEWITESDVPWQPTDKGAAAQITVPAGAVRLIEVHATS